MGRGPSVKSLKKKAEAVALGKRLGELKAEAKKGDEEYTKTLLKQLADKLDPLEVIAIAGTTVIVKNGIEWAEIPMENISSFVWLIGWLAGQAGISDLDKRIQMYLDSPTAEAMQWLASFACAFILIRHFDAVSKFGANVIDVAKGLIGMKALPL